MKIWEIRLQNGIFVYKAGISFTKWDFHLQRETLGLQTGLSLYISPHSSIVYSNARLMSIHCHYIRHINLLKCIKIPLRSDLRIAFVLIIAAFCVHVVHHPNRKKIQIPAGDSELYAAKQKQGCGHRAVSCVKFFLDSTSVWTFHRLNRWSVPGQQTSEKSIWL